MQHQHNNTGLSEQQSFVAVTWFIQPHLDEYQTSAETIARLLDTFHPEVVMLQNLDSKMVDLLKENEVLTSQCYLLFPNKFDDQGKGCGFVIRQPCEPINIGIRKLILPNSQTEFAFSFCKVKTPNDIGFFLATATLAKSDHQLRQKQFQMLLAHLSGESNVILGLSTFEDDTDTSNNHRLVVPLTDGWHDAWWNFDCPIKTTFTFDGNSNPLANRNTSARYDRMYYRFFGRVKAMGFLGRKPMNNSINQCPPSSHYALGAKWVFQQENLDVDVDALNVDDHTFWSVCEHNAISTDSFYKGTDFKSSTLVYDPNKIDWSDKVTDDEIKNVEKARTIFEIEKTVLEKENIDADKATNEEFVRNIVFSGADAKTRQPASFSQAYQRLLSERTKLIENLGPQRNVAQIPQQPVINQTELPPDLNHATEEQVRAAIFGQTASSQEPSGRKRVKDEEVAKLQQEREQDEQLFKTSNQPTL